MVAFVRHLWKKFPENDYFGFAAQLSYFFLLSLFPLLIFLVTLLPYLPLTQGDLLGVFRDFAPSGTMELIEMNLSQISKNGTLLSFGIIGTLWSASNGINAIVKALNRAYEVIESRTFFRATDNSYSLNSSDDCCHCCCTCSTCIWKTGRCISLFTI